MNAFIRCMLLLLVAGAMVPSIVRASHDTLYICQPGELLQIEYVPGFAAYSWTPIERIDNPTVHNPTVRPRTNTTYVVEAITSFGQNLIANADFSEGNTGFTSEYDFVPQAITTQGVYSISNDPSRLNAQFFSPCNDHTDSTGNMLVVDGFPAANVKVWCQTIDVEPNTQYAFSTWVASIFEVNPASLQFFINGNTLGQPFRASSTVCDWRQFYETWDSGISTEAEICIVNQNLNRQGNDFALDDFAFFEIGEMRQDTFSVFIERPAYTIIDTSICQGDLLEIGGFFFPADTNVILPFKTVHGCDSLVEVQVSVLDTIFEFLRVDTLCPGDVLSFLGNTIVQDTLICETFSISPTCDSSYCLVAVYLNETSIGPIIEMPSCPGASDGEITLVPQAGIPPYDFLWEDGTELPSLLQLAAGQYQVSVFDSKNCRASALIEVVDPPVLEPKIRATSEWCNGVMNGQLELAAEGGTPPYEFSINGTQNFLRTDFVESLAIGSYNITVRDANGCESEVQVEIPPPLANRLLLPDEATLNLGDSIIVSITNELGEALEYQWRPESGVACPTCPVTQLTPPETMTYTIVASDSAGCAIEAEWTVRVTRNNALFYPNVFSPNGDGINDSFRLIAGSAIRQIRSMNVFDRWGNQVFERTACLTSGQDCDWSGLTGGRSVDGGVYIFTAEVEYIDGFIETVSGDFLLLK